MPDGAKQDVHTVMRPYGHPAAALGLRAGHRGCERAFAADNAGRVDPEIMPVFLSFGVALAVLTFACYRSLKLSERPHRALVLLSPVPKDLLILHGVWLNLRLFNGSFFDTALAFSPFRKASDIRIITAFRRRLLTGPALAYSSTMITATPVHGGLCGVDLLSGPVFAVVAFVLAKSRAGKLLTSARIGASAEQFTGKDL